MLSSIRLIRDSTSRSRRSAARRSRSRASAISRAWSRAVAACRANCAEQPQIVLGKQRPAPLDDDHRAPAMRGRVDRGDERPRAQPHDGRGQLGLARIEAAGLLAVARDGQSDETRRRREPESDERGEGRGLHDRVSRRRVVAECHQGQRVPHAPRRGLTEIGGRQPPPLLGRPIGGRAQVARLLEPLPADAQVARRRECQEVADADPADQQLVKPEGVPDRRDE